MKDKYYELKVISSQIEPLKDLVFEFGFTCIEEIDSGFIIRDEESLDDTKWGLEEFASRFGCEITTDLQIKDNIDWINEYKKGIAPVAAGDFYIRPSWEKPKDGLIDIIIDPALAFGSGHHESTNSCLKLISKYAKNYEEALDVGCGSGILGIAASKLGAKEVIMTDIDECAIVATNHNMQLNGVKNGKVLLKNLLDDNTVKGDVIACNIMAEVLIAFAPFIGANLTDNGKIILSGILVERLNAVKAAYTEAGFKFTEEKIKGEWSALVMQKGNA